MGGGPSTIKMVQPGGNNAIYAPPGQGAMGQSLYNLVNQAGSYAPGYMGQSNALIGRMVNDPNAQWAMDTAPGVANWGMFAGPQMEQFASDIYGNSSTMRGLAAQGLGYPQQLLDAGFDPRRDLYNRTAQQLQDQTGASMAMGGLLGSPYAAGVMGNTMSNFNIDWQNQQLQRELAAASGWGDMTGAISRLYGGAAGLDTTAAGLQDMGIQTMENSMMLPFNTDMSVMGQQLGLLGGYDQQIMNDYLAYLGLGQTAASNLIGAARTNQAAGAGQMGGFGQLAGSALGAGASIYGTTALSDALAGTAASTAAGTTAAGAGSAFAGYGTAAAMSAEELSALAATIAGTSGAAYGGSAVGAGLLAAAA